MKRQQPEADYDEYQDGEYPPDESPDDYEQDRNGGIYLSSASDPLFGLLIAAAISIGLTPLIATDADMRYTIVWGLLALFGVMSWLLGSGPRIEQEIPENLAWGIAFGMILGLPLLAFAGSTLSETMDLIFRDMKAGTVLAYLIFVMPLAETLFFRGIMQQKSPFGVVGLICTVWSLVLFFPLINRGPYPLIIGVMLLMANMMYSYVKDRNGLAAAWLCQITVNLMLFFIPFAAW